MNLCCIPSSAYNGHPPGQSLCDSFGSDIPVWSGALDFTVTNNYFDYALEGGQARKVGSLQRELSFVPESISENIIGGDVTNSYFFADPSN